MSMARILPAILVLAALGLAFHPQRDVAVQVVATNKLALVIGNSAYPRAPLKNPANDAAGMEAALKQLGFEVTTVRDADLRRMHSAVDEFAARLRPGSIAFFYFAGHGMQINRTNYLVPVDFTAASADDVAYEAYPADRIKDKLEGSGAQLRVMVLDACRNNPWKYSRDAAEGLAPMSVSAVGTLIAYATGDNNTAADNPSEANGLYTKYLIPALLSPGLNLRDVFQKAKEDVYQNSTRRQNPTIYENIVGRYYLAPGPAGGEVSQAGRAAGSDSTAAGPGVPAPDVEAWNAVRGSNSAALFEQFLKEYPNSQYAGAARLRLAALGSVAAGPATSAPAAPTPGAVTTEAEITPRKIDSRTFALPEWGGEPGILVISPSGVKWAETRGKGKKNLSGQCGEVAISIDNDLIHMAVPGKELYLEASPNEQRAVETAIRTMCGGVGAFQAKTPSPVGSKK
jgi:hypothetical protein